jgi:uncharacterized protein (UPF0548 family)
MFLLRQPNKDAIRKFLAAQEDKRFSYSVTGTTRENGFELGYDVDHNRIEIGQGRADFERAKKAIRSWKMFENYWTTLCYESAPIEVGTIVAVVFKHFGFWSINAAKIVYVFEETGAIEKFGFAYGTLQDHSESGEERFSVEFHAKDESVWYDLYAFSRPRKFFARMGYPLARMLQRQFVAESKAAMKRAVRTDAG